MNDSFKLITNSTISCTHDSYYHIMEKCKFCHNEICSSCRIAYKPLSSSSNLDTEQYQCQPCTIAHEREIISGAILTATKSIQDTQYFEINIIEIISSYAIGYVITCCNIKLKCCNEISISNRFALEHPAVIEDSDGNEISDIILDNQNNEFENGQLNIYGRNRKIFCNECTQNIHQTPTPLMMLMATKRFRKNHFGQYQII
eukprot:382702_1